MEKKITLTHKASFWGVRCYINLNNDTVIGINPIMDMLIPVAIQFHNLMTFLSYMLIPDYESPGFMFKIIEEYKEPITITIDYKKKEK